MTTNDMLPGIDTDGDFPLHWADSADAERFWVWDAMHYPRPLRPLSASLDGPAFEAGFNRATEELQLPFSGIRIRFFNHYWFYSIEPYLGDIEERMNRMFGVMGPRMGRMKLLFDLEYLPTIIEANERLLRFNYDGASDEALHDLLRTAIEERETLWYLHFLAVQPSVGAASYFMDVYREIFGEPEDNADLKLLQGFPNKSLQVGADLWRLARRAEAEPAVLAALVAAGRPGAARARIAPVDGGPAFLDAVDELLAECGWQTDSCDFADPPWIHDDAAFFATLALYATSPMRDPLKSAVAAAEERERLHAEHLARLESHPDRASFIEALEAAQQCGPVLEDHNYFIDQMNTALLRLPVLELGRRLVGRGVLTEPDDIFFLTGEELDALRGSEGVEAQSLVAARRGDWEVWAATPPPHSVGKAPDDLPDDPQMARFFGDFREPTTGSTLKGRPAGGGRVTGPAVVITSLDQLHKIEEGVILVCPTTTPALTPVFAQVAGIACDTGGELSHCAVMAREYQLPCVVGTKYGTRRIKDGDIVTVDGGLGLVRIEEAR